MGAPAQPSGYLAARITTWGIIGAGHALLVLALGPPLVWIVAQACYALPLPVEPALDAAAVRLLWRSVLIAAAGALLATLFALPAAFVIAGARRAGTRWALSIVVLLPLLMPSYVHAYLWDLLARAGGGGLVGPIGRILTGWLRAAWVTAVWLWPLPALLLAAGWRRGGSSVYDLALLDLPAWRARWLVLSTVLRPYLAAAAVAVLVLSMVEYALPHMCLVNTYATELFNRAELRRPLGELAWQSWPLMLTATIGAVWLAATAGRVARQSSEIADARPAQVGKSPGLWVALAVVLLVTLGGPLAYAASELSRPAALWESLRTFRPEWAASLQLSAAVAAGVFVTCLAVVSHFGGRATAWARRGWLVVSLLVAVLPAALVGTALVSVFDRPGLLGWFYDASPVVWWLGSLSRFAFVGLLVTVAAGGPGEAMVRELSRLDGLARWQEAWFVRWPMLWRPCLAGAVAAGLLAISEVAVSTLVRPPGTGVIAISLLNQMHFARQDSVIASSLLMVLPAILTGVMFQLVFSRSSRFE